jgi:hypothetical protein
MESGYVDNPWKRVSRVRKCLADGPGARAVDEVDDGHVEEGQQLRHEYPANAFRSVDPVV